MTHATIKTTLTALACLTALSCARGMEVAELPRRAEPPTSADTTLIWLGHGKAFRYTEGKWVRDAKSDYEFTVVQRRYSERWESVKELHRRHPSYDGAAGPRDQSYHFELRFENGPSEMVPFRVLSSLGEGRGHADREFRRAELELTPKVSRFAPFNRMRLSQDYQYERGQLRETVLLVNRSHQTDKPAFKIEESATLFAVTRFEQPPTRAP